MTQSKTEMAKQMYSDGKYVREIADVLGVSRPTVYRVLDKSDEVGGKELAFKPNRKYKKLATSIYNQGFAGLDPRIMRLGQFNLGIPDEVFAIDAGPRTWVLAFIEDGSWGYTVIEITDQVKNRIQPVRYVAPASADISATILFVVGENGD